MESGCDPDKKVIVEKLESASEPDKKETIVENVSRNSSNDSFVFTGKNIVVPEFSEEQLKQIFNNVHDWVCQCDHEPDETCNYGVDDFQADMAIIENTLHMDCERQTRLNFRRSLRNQFEACSIDRLSLKSN